MAHSKRLANDEFQYRLSAKEVESLAFLLQQIDAPNWKAEQIVMRFHALFLSRASEEYFDIFPDE